MTKDYFQEKYNCNSSLIFYYFKKFKNKNIQQIDNIIQERQLLKEKTQNIMTDKTGNDIKEFFNNTTRAYQFVTNLFKIMEDKILVQDRTVDKCIKIINTRTK